MRKLAILAALMLCSSAFATVTLFDEQFDYSTGMLTDVSGGQWMLWQNNPAVPDGVVLANMMVIDGQGTPEVVSYFQDGLGTGPATMTVGLDFFVHEEGQAELEAVVFIGGGDKDFVPNGAEIFYDMWGFIIDKGDTGVGDTGVMLWGAPTGWAEVSIATGLAVDTWHTLELIATQTVADRLANPVGDDDGVFDVLIDGVPVVTGMGFINNGVEGVNSIDIYNYGNAGEQHDFTAFDNIVVTGVPEPGTFAMIGAGLLGLLAFKRRK